MLVASFQKEWLVFRRDDRLLWLLLTLLVMMILGIVSSSYQYQHKQLLKIQAQDAERNRWINQGEKNPHSAAHYGIYLFKPDTPLSTIDPGISDYLGDILFLEAHKRNNPAFATNQDSIELKRLGTLSPVTILQLLLPLFIILCGCGFFSAEREHGTLRMLLLSGQTPRQLFLQKAVALFSFALVFILLIVIFSSMILLGKGDIDVTRLASIALIYIHYFAFWVLLTLAVSLITKTVRQSLTILLLFWVLTCLVIPKLAINIATNTYPGIATQEFYARMESDVYTSERLQAIEAFKESTLKQHNVSHTDELPFNWAGAELLFGEAYSDKIFDKLFGQHTQQLQQQDKLYQKFGLLSPLIGIQIMSSGFSTTDWYHHQLFSTSAENHRRSVMQKLNASLRDHKDENYTGDSRLWTEIPKFLHKYPTIKQIIGYYTIALFSLGFWLLLSIGVSVFSVRSLSREEKL